MKELPRRSASSEAATAEPYFLPPEAGEATAVEVRRPTAPAAESSRNAGAAESAHDDASTEESSHSGAQSAGSRSAGSTQGKPVFVPKGAPRREPEKTPAKRPPSHRPRVPASPHVRFRALMAIPVVAAVLFTVALALAGTERAGLYRAELAIVEGLGFWGCLAAALIFESGDYMRRAWLLEMSCYGLIFVGDLTLTTGVFSNRPWTALANGVLTLAANAGAMGGTLMLARAARVAGIEMPGSDAARRGVQALAIAVAVVAAGPAAVISARQVLAGDQSGLMYFASCLGDMFCFALIAPLLLTTVAMRGGLLAWPWGFMTASGLAWLTFDAVQTLSPILLGISAQEARPVLEVARCLACTCAFSAGLAQRWTILDVSD